MTAVEEKSVTKPRPTTILDNEARWMYDAMRQHSKPMQEWVSRRHPPGGFNELAARVIDSLQHDAGYANVCEPLREKYRLTEPELVTQVFERFASRIHPKR